MLWFVSIDIWSASFLLLDKPASLASPTIAIWPAAFHTLAHWQDEWQKASESRQEGEDASGNSSPTKKRKVAQLLSPGKNKKVGSGDYGPELGIDKERVFRLSTGCYIANIQTEKLKGVKNAPPIKRNDKRSEFLCIDALQDWYSSMLMFDFTHGSYPRVAP